MRAFITVIGGDKIGIIYGVTSVLQKYKVNILDINQTLLQEYFAMMMLVDLKEMSIGFQELKEELVTIGKELGVSIKLQHEDLFKTMHTI